MANVRVCSKPWPCKHPAPITIGPGARRGYPLLPQPIWRDKAAHVPAWTGGILARAYPWACATALQHPRLDQRLPVPLPGGLEAFGDSRVAGVIGKGLEHGVLEQGP